MNFFLVRMFESFVDKYPITCRMLRFGEYGDPPHLLYFFVQLIAWVSIVIVVKIIILSLMLNLLLPINGFLAYIFSALESHADLELVMVMIVIPTILNTLAFWVTDTVLKKKFNFDQFSHGHMPLKTTDTELEDDLVDEVSAVICYGSW